jgi:hypothetical protein
VRRGRQRVQERQLPLPRRTQQLERVDV